MKLNRLEFKKFNNMAKNDIVFDYHIHTSQTDGKNTAKEMIEEAEKLNFSKIAFTEHIRKDSDWFFDFKNNIENLKKLSNTQILIGIEAKPLNFNGTIDASEEILGASNIIVGSVHRYPKKSGELIPLEDIPSLGEKKAAKIEFNLAKGLLKKGQIDILGHIFGIYYKYFDKFQEKYLRELLSLSLKNKVAIEINTKYLKNKKDFLRLLKEINPYVSLGSDAHSKKELARNFQELKNELKKK